MTLFDTIYLVLGAYIILRSSTYVISSLTNLALFFGLSGFTISFILMAFATSIPELVVGVTAAIAGNPGISLGNILGTNIVNLSLVLGLVALISGKIVMDEYQKFSSNRLFNLFLVMSPAILLLDGILSRADGIVLLLFFVWNLWRMFEFKERLRQKGFRGFFRKQTTNSLGDFSQSITKFFKNFAIFSLSVAILVIAAHYFIVGAKNVSIHFGLSDIFIGIFIVGLGTSLPELVFGVRAARSKQGGMSLGNIFGSSVVNSTLILGVTALIYPITVGDTTVFWIGVVFMALTMLLAYYLLRSKDFLTRREGIFLILIYVVFLIIQVTSCIKC